MTSISEAASEIWKKERDTVERIVFVEQLCKIYHIINLSNMFEIVT